MPGGLQPRVRDQALRVISLPSGAPAVPNVVDPSIRKARSATAYPTPGNMDVALPLHLGWTSEREGQACGAAWKELIFWEGWESDGGWEKVGGRAAHWKGGAGGLVTGEQKGKCWSSGSDGRGLFSNHSPSLQAGGVTRRA